MVRAWRGVVAAVRPGCCWSGVGKPSEWYFVVGSWELRELFDIGVPFVRDGAD